MNQRRNQEVPELNKNEKTAQQKSLGAYLTKLERVQMNGLMAQPKNWEKQEQTKPKSRRWQKILKFRAECNKIEMKKTIQTNIKSWFLEKLNKADRPLAHLTKRKNEIAKINRIRNEQRNITTEEIQGHIRGNSLKTQIPLSWKM